MNFCVNCQGLKFAFSKYIEKFNVCSLVSNPPYKPNDLFKSINQLCTTFSIIICFVKIVNMPTSPYDDFYIDKLRRDEKCIGIYSSDKNYKQEEADDGEDFPVI